jgi:hypothetical protein
VEQVLSFALSKINDDEVKIFPERQFHILENAATTMIKTIIYILMMQLN